MAVAEVGAPVGGQLVRAYTPEAMIEVLIAHPDWALAQYAREFGRSKGWMASVLASEAFQQTMAPHKNQILNPAITATMEERVRALAIRSMDVLQEKLDSKEVSDLVVLKATELGIKGLGMGQAKELPRDSAPSLGVEALADRLVSVLNKQRENSRVIDVTPVSPQNGS